MTASRGVKLPTKIRLYTLLLSITWTKGCREEKSKWSVCIYAAIAGCTISHCWLFTLQPRDLIFGGWVCTWDASGRTKCVCYFVYACVCWFWGFCAQVYSPNLYAGASLTRPLFKAATTLSQPESLWKIPSTVWRGFHGNDILGIKILCAANLDLQGPFWLQNTPPTALSSFTEKRSVTQGSLAGLCRVDNPCHIGLILSDIHSLIIIFYKIKKNYNCGRDQLL